MEAYKQEKFEVMQRARAYGITMMVGTQDECDVAFFDFKKKLDSFEDMTFEAGAASRDAEVVSLTNQRDYEYVRAENAEQERDQFEQERDQLREHVTLLRDALHALTQCAPAEVECNNMNHKNEDQHSHDETCPVIVRYATALYDAQEALAATEPKP